jgi:hypothetical protein
MGSDGGLVGPDPAPTGASLITKSEVENLILIEHTYTAGHYALIGDCYCTCTDCPCTPSSPNGSASNSKEKEEERDLEELDYLIKKYHLEDEVEDLNL